MFKTLFKGTWQRFANPYQGHYWMWHIVAAGTTAFLVLSGIDWWFFKSTRSDALYPLIMIAGIGGFFMPIILPIVLYIIGKTKNLKQYILIAIGVTQASLVSWVIVAIYKTFTGRTQPEYLTTYNSLDISRSFQFGFFENGIFWGWPSHHTVVAVAAMTVLYIGLRNRFARLIIIIWALVVSSGAAVGFHWLSDVVAGVIVGVVVGVTVWREIVSQNSK